MAFIKKVLVLKRTENDFSVFKKALSGIARVEIESGVAELHVSLINLPQSLQGEYFALAIDSEKREHFFNLGSRPTASAMIFNVCPEVEKGVAVGVYVVKDGIPITLAFAETDGFYLTLSDFKRAVAEKCIADRKLLQKKEDLSETEAFEQTKDVPENPPNSSPEAETIKIDAYNDEAVATENYYNLERSIDEKLKAIEELSDGNLRFENELPIDGSEKKEEACASCANRTQNEADARSRRERSEKEPYFISVGGELKEIFEKFPPEICLEKAFTDSKWARINYSKDKYYVVGIIKEDGAEKYICYGVPAVYSAEPPEELKGYCSFIPLSVFDMNGDGYWMMFQDAVSGNCIKFGDCI